jgi:hypothetical protein
MSLHQESFELGLACETVHGVLHERLKLHAYKLTWARR